MKKVNLDTLVGNRFLTLDEVKKNLENLGAENVSVFQSESDRLEGLDFMIDGSINDEEDFTLFYIFDNANQYYITETCFNN